ncbi:peptidoglycan-binding protein [Mangrovivirga sp. M17]|uniref:Peptidoglycan-binding protein n=1 Tax=Mangrovivirga halotolerans TaxID=2993936 RepID=A0ABT3RLK2_9BACT|nr:peptidoglycan-binding protein [Mangrovivirga halotolerans]MCX2742258.1 peptidoglycan-binding protein [Mangrovivirga halotolerans]
MLPENEMIFFGLRGCTTIHDDSMEFKEEHTIEIINYDHIHPNCIIGQYHKEKGIALFPGSTVPHFNYVSKSIPKNGRGTNMLLTGYYSDYRKGWHKAGKPTGHEAFRQDNKLPVRRTMDDADYDNDDRVEYTRPYDNIHAAWCMSASDQNFASAGCQVIVGYPKCKRRVDPNLDLLPETGPWKYFRQNAYDIDQKSFNYLLLNGKDALKVATQGNTKLSPRLRYGSQGKLVKEVQKILKNKNFYEGRIDGDFGSRSLRAVLEFQEVNFGLDGDDGIVGPITASAMGLEWPERY